jgi:leader peptidase (prepilin peptidase)/N-methyltransferase
MIPFGSSPYIQIAFIGILLYLAYIDFRTFRLPNVITLPLLATGLALNTFTTMGFANAQAAWIGVCLGYSLLWLPNYLYRLIKRKDGIGMGDAKLLAALGACLGWVALPGILLIASLSGLIGGLLWLKWHKRSYGQAFPFGPFLAIAGIIQLLWPQLLTSILPIPLI